MTKVLRKAWKDCQCFANTSTPLCLSVCYVTTGENRNLAWNQREHSTIMATLQIIHGWSVRTFTYWPRQPSSTFITHMLTGFNLMQEHVRWRCGLFDLLSNQKFWWKRLDSIFLNISFKLHNMYLLNATQQAIWSMIMWQILWKHCLSCPFFNVGKFI